MKTIIQIMLEEKLADNNFHAANMLNVLQCQNLKTDEERLARCRLYKAWKLAGENKPAARLSAIAGKAVPVVDMFSDKPLEIANGEAVK